MFVVVVDVVVVVVVVVIVVFWKRWSMTARVAEGAPYLPELWAHQTDTAGCYELSLVGNTLSPPSHNGDTLSVTEETAWTTLDYAAALALGCMVSGRTSVRYRFGSPFSSKRLWFVDTVL